MRTLLSTSLTKTNIKTVKKVTENSCEFENLRVIKSRIKFKKGKGKVKNSSKIVNKWVKTNEFSTGLTSLKEPGPIASDRNVFIAFQPIGSSFLFYLP